MRNPSPLVPAISPSRSGSPEPAHQLPHRIVIEDDGTVRFVDLARETLPLAAAFDPTVGSLTQSPIPWPDPVYRWVQRIPVDADKRQLVELDTGHLWALHNQALEQMRKMRAAHRLLPPPPVQSLLDLKIELARRMLETCDQCHRLCGANRWKGEVGDCGVGRVAQYTQAILHLAEETLVRPSAAIFLAGCPWRCVFCQNPQGLNPKAGVSLEPEGLAATIRNLVAQGARTIDWVGGDPDPHLWPILRTLRELDVQAGVTWNSNGCASEPTMQLLDGLVDVYLTDLRFGPSDACAVRLARAPAAWETVTRNLRLAATQALVLVRVLQLPGHWACCTRPVLDWLARELPGVMVNLMDQYYPYFQARRYAELAQPLAPEEHTMARRYATALELNLVE